MTVGHKAGHYCHFRVLRSVIQAGKRKKKESFAVYWEGDDTLDLKVPMMGDRTASWGSSFQLLTGRGKVLLL